MSPETTQRGAGASGAPSTTSAAGAPAVTLTKSGTVSKMRSHRGNVPTLPQTKFCHLCTAKFTRTTHLNRHLKTHSNERLHECDRCGAQFTRSDLLSRHKRTCCDASIANRSRRKSCQSCADSKVKCDLQRPCSRCKAKDRECVYVNVLSSVSEGGSYSRNKESPGRNSGDKSASPSPSLTNEASSDVATRSNPPTPGSSSSHTSSNSQTSSGSVLGYTAPSSSHTVDIDPTAATGTLVSQSAQLPTSSTAVSHGQLSHEKGYLSELVSTEMYDSLFSDVFTSSFEKTPAVPGQYFHPDPTAILTDRMESLLGVTSTYSGYIPVTEQMSTYDIPELDFSLAIDSFGNLYPNEIMQPTIPVPVPSGGPTTAELNQYLSSFLSIFLHHVPLIHIPTFLSSPSIPILLTAMQACGAMWINTPTAAKFIESVLATGRDLIIAELSSGTKSHSEIIQLSTASALIQTIGLYHRDSAQRARSNVYHGMIVMMLRMEGFVDRTRDWKFEPFDFSDPVATELAWKDWVAHESAKRAIWICYLHDCCHSIYFNLYPTFRTEQFTLGLPCEDALWTAKDAREWAILLQTPSPYGSVEARLRGHSLKALYSYLTQNNPENAPRPFNAPPFAHFITIHAIMRKLFEMYLGDRLPQQPANGSGGSRPKVRPHFVSRERVFHVQILLHHWLESWLGSPETPRGLPERQQRFIFNALPFYWVSQVALVAYQEGLPPFDPEGTYITSHDSKFYLMKKWERHARKFLASGEQTATRFWDEVMKIRIETWQAETGFEYEHLMGFFQREFEET
ncbi:fungal-specific transcription factor domain-containing protein [Trametes polyzona]|nr:fungal-specific transcription factor domain-containing protein [Trametes polyzona]